MKLTNDLLKRSMPEAGKRLELRDDDEPGLIFRVTENGVRSWSVRYRNAAGEQRRKSLGPYPSVTLSRAREEARKVKGAVAGGSDVVGADRAHKAQEAGRKLHRLTALADAYFADAAMGMHKANARGPKRQSTIVEERRVFDKLVSPALEAKSVPEIKRADIQAMVSKISRKSAGNGRQSLAVNPGDRALTDLDRMRETPGGNFPVNRPHRQPGSVADLGNPQHARAHAADSRKNATSFPRSATQRPPTFLAGNVPLWRRWEVCVAVLPITFEISSAPQMRSNVSDCVNTVSTPSPYHGESVYHGDKIDVNPHLSQ